MNPICTPPQVGKSEQESLEALDKFKELTEAYEILGDQATRRPDDRERDRKTVALRTRRTQRCLGSHAAGYNQCRPCHLCRALA